MERKPQHTLRIAKDNTGGVYLDNSFIPLSLIDKAPEMLDLLRAMYDRAPACNDPDVQNTYRAVRALLKEIEG